MQTGTVLTPISLLLSGLLVLAGVFSDARLASAQAPLDCPLPTGVTPPADPPVTAQQVEDGSASLTDFALAALTTAAAGDGGPFDVLQDTGEASDNAHSVKLGRENEIPSHLGGDKEGGMA